MKAIINHHSGYWDLTVHDIRGGEDLVLREHLGGRKMSPGVYQFPDDLLYLYQVLRTFPEIKLSATAVARFEYVWGFPRQMNGIECSHPSWDKLYDFQKEGVDFLVSSPKHGSLLALSPGLGKSAVSIIASQWLGFKDVLVISPLSLLHTWVRECKTWGQTEATITRGSDEVPETGWVVTNYDTVVRHPQLYQGRWDLIILDESILVKNRKTKRYAKLKTLTGMARKVWLLSGSPISKAADDLFTQFYLIDPKGFKSYWRFANAYCIIDETPWGKDVVGSKDLDFQSEFRDLMFVRNQGDVLNLPEVLTETIDVDLTPRQSKHYQSALDFLIQSLSKGDLTIPNRIAQMIRLQEISSNLVNLGEEFEDESSKADAIIELLEAQAIELPLIIWTHWTKGAHKLVDRLLRVPHLVTRQLSADLTSEQRNFYCQEFQGGHIDVLVVSQAVGKFGLTLTQAKTVIYHDRTFSMDDYVQSYYRVVRIGLNHSPLVITLRCPGTIDELVEQNLHGKAIDISKISDLDLLRLLESSRNSN